MAKITTVVGARFEQSDPVLDEFKQVMDGHGLNQSTLVKLIFRYALMEDPENFTNWIENNTIIIK